MSCGELTGDLKPTGKKIDETCGVRFCNAKKAKNRKIYDEKGGDKQNKQDSCSTMKNKTHFSL